MIEAEMETGKYRPTPLEYWGSDEYQGYRRSRKMNKIWNECMKSKFGNHDQMAPIKWTEFPETFTHDGNISFDRVSDALPENRPKTVHTQGLVAKAKWVPVANGYGLTGIFAEGHDTVLLRVSET